MLPVPFAGDSVRQIRTAVQECAEKMKKVFGFLKKEAMLTAAMIAAIVSFFFVPFGADAFRAIDWKTLALLYSLMVIVAGAGKAGAFTALAHSLCIRAKSSRALSLVLVLLCFFSAMLITNDVALLTFVPFAVTVLAMSGEGKQTAPVVVLQTIAANLGSMLTPPGNPQNIHLFSFYEMGAGEFFSATLPVCGVSLVLLIVLCCCLKKEATVVDFGERPGLDKKLLLASGALFILSLFVVFRVLPWPVLLAAVIVGYLVLDRRLLLKADFLLLLTFVCFFVFVGNISRVDSVRVWLSALLTGREMTVSALASQVISNVPAAVLLSGFTDNGRALLLGVNIGGLGTPIASLASLISLKQYSRAEGADPGRYLRLFLLLNFALLIVLLLFARFVLL